MKCLNINSDPGKNILSMTNKSYEQSLYSKPRIKPSNGAKISTNLVQVRQFDLRHKSIGSPNMDELKRRYSKRMSEKSQSDVYPAVTTEHSQIISYK